MASGAGGMTTLLVWAPLVLVVGGSVMYHLSAKSIPSTYDPMAALIGLYATAFVGAVIVYGTTRAWKAAAAPTRVWHPTIAMVGLGALLIEMGFLLAYRGGLAVSTTSVVANGIVAVLLVALGSLWFGEAFTLVKVIGVLLCLAGVGLLQR
jgi:multidrug transporter EmrE-like cation transporter